MPYPASIAHPQITLRLAAAALCGLLTACSPATPPEQGTAGAKKGKSDHLVVVEPVAPTSSTTRIEQTGTLRARREIQVLNLEEGLILDLPFHEGDRVIQGAELVRIDDRLLQAELAGARAKSALARVVLNRIRDLATKNAASEEQLTNARAGLDIAEAEERGLETRIGFTRIQAPFAGVISARKAEPGAVAQRYTHLLTLTDPASVVAEVRVSELVLPLLAPGHPVTLRVDALGDATFAGRILRIFPTLDPGTRQGTVETVPDPIPPGIQPGQFVRVSLETAAVPRILIPFVALRRDREGEFVFLDDAGRARRTPVQSGLRIGDRIEIRGGLTPGRSLIVRGFLDLTDGKGVRATSPQAGPEAPPAVAP